MNRNLWNKYKGMIIWGAVIVVPVLFAVFYLALSGSDNKNVKPKSPKAPTHHQQKPLPPSENPLKAPVIEHASVTKNAISKDTFASVDWADERVMAQHAILAAEVFSTNSSSNWKKNYQVLEPFLAASAKEKIYNLLYPREEGLNSTPSDFVVMAVIAEQDPQTAQRIIYVQGKLNSGTQNELPIEATVEFLPQDPLITNVSVAITPPA